MDSEFLSADWIGLILYLLLAHSAVECQFSLRLRTVQPYYGSLVACRETICHPPLRETLTLFTRLASPDVFRMIAWDNGVKLLKLRI